MMKKIHVSTLLFGMLGMSVLTAISCDMTSSSGNQAVAATTVRTTTTTTTLPPYNATPKDYYVDGNTGSDTNGNDGTTSGTAFRTLNKAASQTLPGDTVHVAAGTYTSSTGSILNITRSGNLAQPITYIGAANHATILNVTGSVWNAVSINGSCVVFDGFDVGGNNSAGNPQATLTAALAAYNDALGGGQNWSYYAQFNTNGISIGGPGKASNLPHNVTIQNCIVHDWAGGGISSIQADYTTIKNNTVYNNAWFTMYGASGISILNPFNSDHSTGYKNYVLNNIVYNNKTLVPWIGKSPPGPSDGNGIIIDVNVTPYHNGVAPDSLPFSGRTLVENNVSYYNGGSGMHAYLADHVDIINNTAYSNGMVVGYHDIFLNASKDSRLINNIIYGRDSGVGHSEPSSWGIFTGSSSSNAGSVYDYNVYYNVTITGNSSPGPHSTTGQDPLFVSLPAAPTSDTASLGTADFGLSSDSSPAVGNGTGSIFGSQDILGASRSSSHVDIGAYQSF